MKDQVTISYRYMTDGGPVEATWTGDRVMALWRGREEVGARSAREVGSLWKSSNALVRLGAGLLDGHSYEELRDCWRADTWVTLEGDESAAELTPETSPHVALSRWAEQSPGGRASMYIITNELWERGGRHRDAAEILLYAFAGAYSCPKADDEQGDEALALEQPLADMVDMIDDLAVEGLTPVLFRIAEMLAHQHERLTALEEGEGEPVAERPWPTELGAPGDERRSDTGKSHCRHCLAPEGALHKSTCAFVQGAIRQLVGDERAHELLGATFAHYDLSPTRVTKRCDGCAHLEQRATSDSPLWCKKDQRYTRSDGWCGDWAPAEPIAERSGPPELGQMPPRPPEAGKLHGETDSEADARWARWRAAVERERSRLRPAELGGDKRNELVQRVIEFRDARDGDGDGDLEEQRMFDVLAEITGESPPDDDCEPERPIDRIRWCSCGQPWIPASGFGVPEESQCPACVLRSKLSGCEDERERLTDECRRGRATVERLTAERDSYRKIFEEVELAHQAELDLNVEHEQVVAVEVGSALQDLDRGGGSGLVAMAAECAECKRGRETLQRLTRLARQLTEMGRSTPRTGDIEVWLRMPREAHDELCTLLTELSD
jgi:hypothetical protein